MNDIISLNLEEYLKQNEFDFFQIILVTNDGYWVWTGNGCAGMTGDRFLDSKVYPKEELAKAYYTALRFFKFEFPGIGSGRLEIVALPKFL